MATNSMNYQNAMNEKASFPFSLDHEGAHYAGRITPSAETDKYGIPVYYRVMLGNRVFAYLCCGEMGWGRKDQDEEGDSGLVQAIGRDIKRHYE
jgi:hypothetical protein